MYDCSGVQKEDHSDQNLDEDDETDDRLCSIDDPLISDYETQYDIICPADLFIIEDRRIGLSGQLFVIGILVSDGQFIFEVIVIFAGLPLRHVVVQILTQTFEGALYPVTNASEENKVLVLALEEEVFGHHDSDLSDRDHENVARQHEAMRIVCSFVRTHRKEKDEVNCFQNSKQQLFDSKKQVSSDRKVSRTRVAHQMGEELRDVSA